MVEVVNAMDYDAAAVGNHEFDFGLEALRKRVSEIEKSAPQHLTGLIGPLARITTGGYSVTPLEIEALLAICQRRIKPNDWVVCAGSLPAGMPTDFY